MDTLDTLLPSIVSDIAAASQDFAERARADVADRLSVPVGYEIGPNGGTRKIRSKEGEPARKDSGDLVASIRAETIHDNDEVHSSVSVNVPYAGDLEEKLHRLVITDMMPAYEDGYFDRVVEAVDNPAPNASL